MVVVEQPLTGGRDVHLSTCGVGQPLVRLIENGEALAKPREQWSLAAVGWPRHMSLASGECACPFSQMLGAKQLAAYRANKDLVAVARRRGEPSGERRG